MMGMIALTLVLMWISAMAYIFLVPEDEKRYIKWSVSLIAIVSVIAIVI